MSRESTVKYSILAFILDLVCLGRESSRLARKSVGRYFIQTFNLEFRCARLKIGNQDSKDRESTVEYSILTSVLDLTIPVEDLCLRSS